MKIQNHLFFVFLCSNIRQMFFFFLIEFETNFQLTILTSFVFSNYFWKWVFRNRKSKNVIWVIFSFSLGFFFFFFFGVITKWSRLTLIKTSLPYLFSFPSRLLSPISKNSLRHFFQFLWLHIKMRIHFSENGKPKRKTLPKIFSPYRTYDFLDLKTWYGLGQVSNCTRSF